MKLMQLKLENFQGIRAFEINPMGQDLSIYGENSTGKTTLFTAFTWLLFNKPSDECKNFTPQTENTHNLNHTAEAVLLLDSGQEVTLRKTFREVWQNKRGTASKVMTGHTTDYYIDGLGVSEREYNYRLEQLIMPAERMKLLTMPNYFTEVMDWENRRRLLLEICGDLTDAEVLERSPELKPLLEVLRKNSHGDLYSVDEYKKIVQAQMTKLNNDLKTLPGRIDEAHRAIPDIHEMDPAAIETRLDGLNSRKAQLLNERQAALSADAGEAEHRRQMQQAQDDLKQAQLAYQEKTGQMRLTLQTELMELRNLLSVGQNELRQEKNALNEGERKLSDMERLRANLLSEYQRVAAAHWDKAAGICPTCRRPLPDDEVAALKSDYNKRKSEQLEAINQRGMNECSQDMIKGQQERIENHRQSIEAQESKLAELEAKIAVVQEQTSDIAEFEQTQQYLDLQRRIAQLKKAGVDQQAMAAERTKAIDAQLLEVNAEIDRLMSDKSKIALAKTQQKRIAELMEKEKQLGAEYERLQSNLYLCEEFVRTKVKMLDERINSRFQNVRFRLFVEQQNGGLKECCEVLVPNAKGVLIPYNSPANKAGRFNAGLEIIDTLDKYWGVSMPVFVDNAESVTKLWPIEAQLIRLVVSGRDKVLRIESGRGGDDDGLQDTVGAA